MLRVSARIVGLFAASGACVCASFVGCAFETGGLVGASGLSGTTAGSPVTSSGTGGSTTSVGSGGHGGAGGDDAGSKDAGSEAAPVDAGPTAYASCLDWITAHPGASSGVYDLLDGTGNVYQAHCEMAGGGGDAGDAGDAGPAGGWTLALKIDGTKTTFPYADPLWTNSTAYSADTPALDLNEAKLASFWSVAFTELRVGMIDAGVTRWLIVPIGSTSLLDLINQGGDTNLGRGPWEGLVTTGSLQTNCNWEGINAKGHVRIGIVGDESFGCSLLTYSPDSFIGFGADTSFRAPSFDCGNIAHDSPDNGEQTTMTFGYVMVR